MSVQLYTVRDLLASDPGGTIDALARLGFTAVEPFGLPQLPEAVRSAIAVRGLSTPTAHGSIMDNTAETLAVAQALGVQTIIEPFQNAERFADRSSIAAVAEQLNVAAAEAAQHGITIGYHNHDAELRGTVDGLSPLVLLAELTESRVVFELDAYWAAVAGVDGVAIARALGDRLIAVHVKDGDPAAGVDKQMPAGHGSVPLAEVLAAAPQARPVIEFDVLPAKGWDAIASSVEFVSAFVAAEGER